MLPDSPISATSASPGMTRMSPNTITEDRIVDPKEVLRRLRVQVLVGPLVDADGVTGLEPPRHAVPLVVDVAAVVGRVVELGDLDVDVEVPLEVLLDELHLRRHLREVL